MVGVPRLLCGQRNDGGILVCGNDNLLGEGAAAGRVGRGDDCVEAACRGHFPRHVARGRVDRHPIGEASGAPGDRFCIVLHAENRAIGHVVSHREVSAEAIVILAANGNDRQRWSHDEMQRVSRGLRRAVGVAIEPPCVVARLDHD